MLIVLIWLGLFGACIGSFLNVVIYRLPQGKLFKESRSYCPACGETLKAADLIPVFSWLLLRGRCRRCRARISVRYPLVELTCAGLAVLSFLRFGFDWRVILAFGAASILLAVALIDRDTMEIPNSLVLALVPFALAAVWLWPGVSLPGRGLGFLAVSLPMLLLSLVIRGAFGGGDIKLMAVCGFLLGWQNTLLAMFLALLTGGVYAAFLLIGGKARRGSHMAFGPHLCAGTVTALFWGPELITLYLGYFNLG